MRHPDTHTILGVFPQAFELRPADEGALSCAWLQHYPGARPAQVVASITQFKIAMTVRPSGAFTVGDVSGIKETCQRYGVGIRIVHAPEPNHIAHSEVRRFSDSELELLQALADDSWCEIYPA